MRVEGTTSRKVAIVEDDRPCADVVRSEVEGAGWQAVVYHCARDAVVAAEKANFPSLVIMDLGLPGEDAMGAISAIVQGQPGRAVIALTGHSGDDFLFRALSAGAVGYVLKNDGLGRIAEVLEQVAAGGSPMSPRIARRVVATFQKDAEPSAQSLTKRETEVLTALGAGHTYDGVAEVLGVSVDTVRQHVRNLYRKLHASSKAEAVAVAIRAGFIR